MKNLIRKNQMLPLMRIILVIVSILVVFFDSLWIKTNIGIRYEDSSKMKAILGDVKAMLSSHPEIGLCALGSRYNHCVRRAKGRTGRATDAEQKLGRSSSRAHQRSDGHTWCGGNGSGIVQRRTLHQGVHS